MTKVDKWEIDNDVTIIQFCQADPGPKLKLKG